MSVSSIVTSTSSIMYGLVGFVGNVLHKRSGPSRFDKYKNRGKTVEAMRRRRADANEELRREQRVTERQKFLDAKHDACFEMDRIVDSFTTRDMLRKITSGDTHSQIVAVQQLKGYIIREFGRDLVDIVLESGLMPCLISILKYSDSFLLQYESAATLKILTSGSSSQIDVLIKCGCVPTIIRLLSCDVADITEQAVWAIGNIVSDRFKLRDKEIIGEFVTKFPTLEQSHLQLPMIRALIRRVPQTSREELGIGGHFVYLIKRHVCYKAFGDLTRANNPELIARIKTVDNKSVEDIDLNELLSRLDDIIICEDFTLCDLPLIRAIVWAMSVITEITSPGNEKIYLPAIVKLLTYAENDELTFGETCESLRILHVSVNDDVIERVLQSGVIPQLVDKLDLYDIDIFTCALRAVEIIASGSETHTQALIDGNVFRPFSILLNSPHVNLQRRSARCIEFISNKNANQRLALIQSGLVTRLVRKFEQSDEIVQQITLKILFNLVHDCNAQLMTQLINSEIIQALCKAVNTYDQEKRSLMGDLLTVFVVAAEKCKLMSVVLEKIKRDDVVQKITSNWAEVIAISEIVNRLTKVFSLRELFSDMTHTQEQFCIALDAYFATEVLDLNFNPVDMQSTSLKVPSSPNLQNEEMLTPTTV